MRLLLRLLEDHSPPSGSLNGRSLPRDATWLARCVGRVVVPFAFASGCNALFGIDQLSFRAGTGTGGQGDPPAGGAGEGAGVGGAGAGGAGAGGVVVGGGGMGGYGGCQGGSCQSCDECDFEGQLQCAGAEQQLCVLVEPDGCRRWALPEPCPNPPEICLPGPPVQCDLPHPVAAFDWENNQAQGWTATTHTTLARGNPPGGLTIDAYYDGAFRLAISLPSRSYAFSFDAFGNGEELCGSPRTGARGQLYVTDSANEVHLVWDECIASGPGDGYLARGAIYSGDVEQIAFSGQRGVCTAFGDETDMCGEFVTIDNLVIDY